MKAIPPCAGFPLCPEMNRLSTLSNLPHGKVYHFGLPSKDDIKKLIVDRLCQKASNDCECECADSQLLSLISPTTSPTTTRPDQLEGWMSSEEIKKLVKETVQEALTVEKNKEKEAEYPVSPNLALGRPSLFHSYGVSENIQVITDGKTCYEHSCCASTEYS